MSDPVKVTISRHELNEAIIMYAAGKAHMKYPLKHSVEINGILTLMGGDDEADTFCTVTLEHLENVTPLRKR